VLPFTFDDLADRFSKVRPWAAAHFGEINRCAICMGFTLRLSPSKQEGDASLGDLVDAGKKIAGAERIEGGPQGDYGSVFFIRASELLPRVQRAFGRADVEGPANQVWSQVQGIKGVLFIENCYPTAGDKSWTIKGIYEPTSGDHWDLFDGMVMVTEKEPIRDNRHSGALYFWKARSH